MASNNAADRRAAQDEVLVAALARGLSHEHAGQLAGVSGRTVERRLEDPEFAERVAALRRHWADQLTGELLDLASDALLALRREIQEAEKSTDRIRASAVVLTHAYRFRHGQELEARLRAYEQDQGLAPRHGTDGSKP
jgi:hypothetical protein